MDKKLSERIRQAFEDWLDSSDTASGMDDRKLVAEVESLEVENQRLKDNLQIDFLERALNSRDYWKTRCEEAESRLDKAEHGGEL